MGRLIRRIAPLALLAALVFPAQLFAADPIKVGGLFASSGKSAFVGTASKLVAEMTVKQINAAGGILGRPLEMVIYDTESDPNVALQKARQLVEKDGVLAIIGPTTTGGGMAIKQYTEAQQIPSIMTVGGDAIIAGGKYGPFLWTFKVPQRTETAVKKIYALLHEKGLKTVGILTAQDGFGQDGMMHLEAQAAHYGLTVVAKETLDPKDSDYSAQAFKLTVGKPDAVVVWVIGPSGAIAQKNFKALPNYTGLVVQCHGQPDPKFIELAGAASEGALMPGTKLMAPDALAEDDPQRPVIKQFLADYTANGYDKEFPINTHSGYALDALLLLKAGLEKAGAVDRAALRDALEQLKGVVGVSGVFSMTPEDHNGLDEASMLMLTVKDGVFRVAQ
ncbi:ABC transporter substrate-binding protein [Megalodesulfovibrio gigas]|uniref:Putative Extracellular ligand-binding receptor n=1 Tax=Megalodesulfovibrio gigas (strain ATCC 19364 / DSM 1382 / NCIMB 9332 / VKM B-1759) TaxID=1121448 RepID=T2GAF5_MEGG1|nr:ABC transporter substrate-binding protein [Megalodesulfovibrio gigas]AGW12907.1 putative Extracellular ligand-binding receptor [Megalodesulfovibrio gigas DSM 1382 = ATCC 19364]